MSRKYIFFEMDSIDFENSCIKNNLIQSSKGEWLAFVDNSVTSKDEIEQIFNDAPFLQEYDAVLFGADCLDGEISLLDLLGCPQTVVYALCVRRELLITTGSFNQLLDGSSNYEFLLRAAEMGRVYVVSCSADKGLSLDSAAIAYIVRRYMTKLKEAGRLDEIFLRIVQLTEQMGISAQFNQNMNLFLADVKEYEKIEENTAPCLVMTGDDICAGVLNGFAHSLSDELAALGQAVITTDSRYGDYKNIPTDRLLTQNYKAVIGFQAPAFGKEMFQNMKGKKIQFWFDDPLFFDDFFRDNSKDTYILCQDGNYAEYIKRHYDIPGSMQFSPGGTVIDNLPTEKIYDITFVGNYEPLQECVYEDEFQTGFFEYMITHPDAAFDQGMVEYGKSLGVEYTKPEVVQQLQRVKLVCRNIIDRERHYTIEKIVSSGIKLHVFSENWYMYQGKGKENLIIHPMIYGEEPYRVWSQSKIGLNIMRGHRAGMTERIANIMLCGACCLSDETVYLREHFTDGEDISLFKRTQLDELPDKIRYLLAHDEERERIALAGQKKAFKEHTWRVRAEQLLELLNT